MANIFGQMQHEIATASLIDSALIVEGRRRGRGVGHIVAERSPSPTQGQTGFGSGKDKQDKATTGEIWWKKGIFCFDLHANGSNGNNSNSKGRKFYPGFFLISVFHAALFPAYYNDEISIENHALSAELGHSNSLLYCWFWGAQNSGRGWWNGGVATRSRRNCSA